MSLAASLSTRCQRIAICGWSAEIEDTVYTCLVWELDIVVLDLVSCGAEVTTGTEGKSCLAALGEPMACKSRGAAKRRLTRSESECSTSCPYPQWGVVQVIRLDKGYCRTSQPLVLEILYCKPRWATGHVEAKCVALSQQDCFPDELAAFSRGKGISTTSLLAKHQLKMKESSEQDGACNCLIYSPAQRSR